MPWVKRFTVHNRYRTCDDSAMVHCGYAAERLERIGPMMTVR